MCSGLLINDHERVFVLLYLSFHNVNGFVCDASAAAAAAALFNMHSICIWICHSNRWKSMNQIYFFPFLKICGKTNYKKLTAKITSTSKTYRFGYRSL